MNLSSLNRRLRDVNLKLMRIAFLSKILAVIFALLISVSNTVYADASREYQLKAAYILNFARFIYWPSGSFSLAKDEFNICVYGKNPFGKNLEYLLSKKVQDKSIKINYKEDINDIAECHILYISESGIKNFYKMSSTVPRNILTVSDVKEFGTKGGMIEFIRVDNKIKFLINVTQSAKSGIKYRSQLLEVAESLK